jgi:hypothetical protein
MGIEGKKETMKRTREQKLFYYKATGIYTRKIQELETAEERVCWLFKYKEHLRNCTKCLIFNFWYHCDFFRGGKITKDVVHGLTPPESITRAARHIQNDLGLWLPTEPSEIEARKISAQAVHDWVVMNKKPMGDNDGILL